MKLDNYECDGQMSIFDFIGNSELKASHNLSGEPDYHGVLDEITRLSIETDFENSITLFDCQCGENPEKYFKSCHDYFVKCPKCGRRTEYHPKMYRAMQAWNCRKVSSAHYPMIREFLRYGPHTLVSRPRVEAREWLDRYGVPEWVKWDKNSLPCQNCTWFDGINCCSGGHTNHYEYGYLICDGFYQSIVERKPSTVGDAFPSLKTKIQVCEHSGHTCNKKNLWEVAETLDDIQCPHVCCRNCEQRMCGARCNGSEEPKEPEDDYIKENPTCFYVTGHYLDREQGWHKVPDELPNFTTWQLVDVVLYGKQTGTPWMEHEKWEAKDCSFRSIDDRRNTETTDILAWKLSNEAKDGN